MWILCALLAAAGSAGTSFALKRAVARGGAVVSTVAARMLAGVLLLGLVAAAGAWAPLTDAYWRAVGLVVVPEVLGTLFLSLALRAGDLSLVQPILGLIPGLVMLGGALLLGEVPTPMAAAGVLLVTAGVYLVGLQPGGSALGPLRALGRSPASWYAVGSACAWSLATLVHKIGIDAVGPFPWAVTLAFGSAVPLLVALPVLAWRTGGDVGLPGRAGARPWTGAVCLAGASFAVQNFGLHLALGAAQAGYVMAITSTGILIATVLGIVVLRERAAARTRAAGAVLVSLGAVLIAIFG